jgi:hypothetical protein
MRRGKNVRLRHGQLHVGLAGRRRPYPRALRGRIAALNRLPQHDARDPIVRDVVRQRAADACDVRPCDRSLR